VLELDPELELVLEVELDPELEPELELDVSSDTSGPPPSLGPVVFFDELHAWAAPRARTVDAEMVMSFWWELSMMDLLRLLCDQTLRTRGRPDPWLGPLAKSAGAERVGGAPTEWAKQTGPQQTWPNKLGLMRSDSRRGRRWPVGVGRVHPRNLEDGQ
jgi:hypothetical protein